MTGDRVKPEVTVIVPTHDHAATLDLAIDSVLGQTWDPLEIVVIGDGAGDDTRQVMASYTDSRVRFVDVPKTASRAELVRHRVLMDAPGTFACYLGDDDLMLADHVATMVALLADADFAHPLPAPIAPDGTFTAHPTDLADDGWRKWHLHPRRNAVSLTGVAHRLAAYRSLPFGWREPPTGRWSDHYMWQQWFETPGLRFRTGTRLTVLKFDASLRTGWSPDERRAELHEWLDRSKGAGFTSSVDRSVLAAYAASAARFRLDSDRAEEAPGRERLTEDPAVDLIAARS